jgi:hypothetical protein
MGVARDYAGHAVRGPRRRDAAAPGRALLVVGAHGASPRLLSQWRCWPCE